MWQCRPVSTASTSPAHTSCPHDRTDIPHRSLVSFETLDPNDAYSAGALVANRYRLGEAIGRGGVGIVYRAHQIQSGAPVAIKFLQVGLEDPLVIERFRREARAAARVTHPHVARVIETGEHHGTPYTVMEYLDGRDLENILDNDGAFEITEAVGYVMQACEALAEAHVQGVVHRDIKPANLFLANRPDGTRTIKLLDFGISKLMDLNLADTSITVGFVGSPQYMSPEQLKKGPIDGGCDIWALGVTLFELLADMSPFPNGTLPIICVAILKDNPAPLCEYRPDAPPELQAIVERCLQKRREDRWATVAELADALRPFGPPSMSNRPSIDMPACDPVDEIESRIARFGGRDCVLELAITPAQVRTLPIDHRGAFVLSQVDGLSTIDDLLDISGMPAFETLRLLCDLYDKQAIAPATRIARRAKPAARSST